MERTPNKSQHIKSTLEKKFSCRSSRDSNSQSFDHESGALPTSSPGSPLHKYVRAKYTDKSRQNVAFVHVIFISVNVCLCASFIPSPQSVDFTESLGFIKKVLQQKENETLSPPPWSGHSSVSYSVYPLGPAKNCTCGKKAERLVHRDSISPEIVPHRQKTRRET